VSAVTIVHAVDGTGTPRPGVLVAWRGGDILGSAARVVGEGAGWVVYVAGSGGHLLVDDEQAARAYLGALPGTARTDQPNGQPNSAGGAR
jgi:hypothetical protein